MADGVDVAWREDAGDKRLSELERKVDELTQLLRGFVDRVSYSTPARVPYYYLGGNRGLTHLETGQPFVVDTSDCGLTPWLIMGGHWECWADRVVSAYVRPGMKIVDVGANVGYYTVKWGQMIGADGALHAFEANPEAAQILYENLALNNLHGHVRLHTHAAGHGHGTATLRLTWSNTGMGTLRETPMPPGDVRTYGVAVAPLDDVLSDLSGVDLFKIDVEGSEPAVLKGATKLIERSPNAAFHIEAQTSWEPETGESIDAVLTPLMAGRRLFVLCHDTKLREVTPKEARDYVFGLPVGIGDLFLCPSGRLDRVAEFIA